MVLLGVGNPVRGDDSVGLYIADRLRTILGSRPGLKVEAAPTHPELALSRIDLERSRVLVFDAVETGMSAGSILLANIGDTRYGFFATHNLPLKLLPSVAGNLEKISILGVQPDDLGVGESISPTVRAAAEDVVKEVESQLKGGSVLV